MTYLLVRHKVEDYTKWKAVFDEHEATRRAGGSKGGRLFRSADDPNEIVILNEWEDPESTRQFAQSEDLKEAMKRAGVSEKPDVYFLDQVEQFPA